MKSLPFTKKQIVEIAKMYPPPFHIYDEKAIVANALSLKRAFKDLNFKEFFAVKALPNPHILKILKKVGFGTDCSSLPELELSKIAKISGEDIMFTSNDTPLKEYKRAKELGAIINLDDFSHIDYLHKNLGLPDLLSFRYNPGPKRKGTSFIGDPKEAKYGFTEEQLIEGYKKIKSLGVKRFGLHTMVISNELNGQSFVDTAKMLFDLVAKISKEVGITFEFVNLGGGVGIPYKPSDKPVDMVKVAQEVKKAYSQFLKNHPPLKIYMECGRYITGPYGYLVTTVLHKKHIYKDYIGVDASMANLMRPGMYGAYHHISVVGKENNPKNHTYDVTGSLCENNDKFAIDRKLPKIEIGDILIIHDTGAHGHAMGFNYNGKLRSAELLLRKDSTAQLIRRAETIKDYFATLN